MDRKVLQKFIKYVSQNMLGMLGLSAYILADTIFISKAAGANGITALNLVLPVYSFIFAIGAMIGVGSGISFSIAKAKGEKESTYYFSSAITWALIISIFLMVPGIIRPDLVVRLLGGDGEIVKVGSAYTRTFLYFTPCFMWNHIMNAFVRNDGNPSLAMMATLSSSLFNIIFDYIFMFPLRMGMKGAALATGISPIVGVVICSVHLFTGENTITFKIHVPSIHRLVEVCRLGISAFVGEISSGVTTLVFNMLILRLAGNIGVAAYGVVANSALVATSLFNGISQGSQPLLSDYYGKGEFQKVQQVLRLGMNTAICSALLIIICVWSYTSEIVAFFNSEHSREMALLAQEGMRYYFLGFLFAGINIVGTGYLSATDSPIGAFIASISRGFVAIVLSALVLAAFFGMKGVWLAFFVAEVITCIITECSIRMR